MEKVRGILQMYHALRTSRSVAPWSYGYTNVYENIQHDLMLMDVLEKQVEPLEAALLEYVTSLPPGFLQEWLEYGMNDLRHRIEEEPCESMKANWPIFFGDEEWEGYEISYEKTRKTVETIRNACNTYQYDDPDIVAIHEGKECDCFYMCSYCEQMERAWKKKMTDMHTHPKNVFLHASHQAPFLKAWLAAHIAVHPTELGISWPPMKLYHRPSRYDVSRSVCITDYAEMCVYVKKTREKYKQGGKTPLQCYEEMCRDLQCLFGRLRGTESDLVLFMTLWNHLDMVPLWIRYDRRRCREILEML